ncbi:MAG: aspartate--tRNA ligase [Actinobacteria bacterium]|jgi:aspartyl-tRNA synthetase|nr:aspartate--tRNA ligase [Actinomycetota bacterium]MBT3745628.1 aspartate--tRNA ligase [Actinomycetota bacterium]MBT4010013.1 aspartate--tRNA ligase [Actinomycetota bacterium]MBT4303188.1 aspartate--tRNA ligase [Actinomycetota bacterium]MBT4476095.1 aspartate--tRNA ligase [Actinomycetota bacterium]
MRTDRCGDLRLEDQGRTVTLCGWVGRRREHGEHLAFVDLRDRSGIIQVVVDGAADLRSEYVIQVEGTVRQRPNDTANASLATGDIEIDAQKVTVLSAAEPPPFPLDDRTDIDETLRLRHRYVDLRRARMQRNLAVRAQVNSAVRTAMEEQGFIEVETPMLIASTPEGARDFVVPSRKEPGSFYALPQSPQLFKQLCMIGGVDRYYQIARCLRDEDLRADRQFEFMQLDAEASFVNQEDVLAFISHTVASATEAVTGQRPGEIPQISWLEAQERFGSDKPDTRFGMELVELTEVFAGTEFRAFQADCIKGIRIPGGADLSRNRLDDLTEQCKQWGAKGLVWMRVEADALNSPVAKFLTDNEQSALRQTMEAQEGDLLFLVADERPAVRHILGLLRIEMGRPPVTEGGLNFLWVVDFPLFEGIDEAGNPQPAHHPFTMPHEEDLELLASGDLLNIRSQAYDLVLNGWELGSGSVRIHRGEIQQQIFSLLGISPEEAQEKFGFLLDAFRYGAPPHAGFAFGMDRLIAILAGEENIREVIAYPKTQSGADPLTSAPNPIDDRHLEELGLRVLPPRQ